MDRGADELAKTLHGLVDRVCSNIVAGESLGTMVTLDFGKVVRTERFGTSRRSRDVPIYEASISIQDATWRLEDSTSVICSSAADDNSAESDLVLGLNRLLEQRIIEVNFRNTARDLILHFEKVLSFFVFSVPIRDDPDAENYSIFTPDKILAVGFDGTVEVSSRNKSTDLRVVWENSPDNK